MTNSNKSMAEIIGLMEAQAYFMETSLKIYIEVYGKHIEPHALRRLMTLLEEQRGYIKEAEEAWENRAS